MKVSYLLLYVEPMQANQLEYFADFEPRSHNHLHNFVDSNVCERPHLVLSTQHEEALAAFLEVVNCFIPDQAVLSEIVVFIHGLKWANSALLVR